MALISYRLNFIFVKTTKTAGTSLEVHLSRYCGPEDVATPIIPPVEGHHARNYTSSATGQIFFNHQSLSDIRKHVDPVFYGQAYKFCFERHPVDKCLSHFSMLKNSPTHQSPNTPQSWEAYVERGKFPVDHPKYLDENGAPLVDRIYRYEELQADLHDIHAKLKLEPSRLAVWAKHGWREHPVVTPLHRQVIMDAFSATNDILGYS